MKCPTCKDVTLLISNRNEIEIDYCPECRGVWLDRGELDKIIEKSRPQESETRSSNENRYSETKNYSTNDNSHRSDYKYKRKKSFLEEIFD